MEKDRKTGFKGLRDRFLAYRVGAGDILGIKRHGSLHMMGHGGVW